MKRFLSALFLCCLAICGRLPAQSVQDAGLLHTMGPEWKSFYGVSLDANYHIIQLVRHGSCGDRYMVFESFADNKNRLVRTDADGSNPFTLAEDVFDGTCSPDGTWVLYAGSDLQHLYRIPIEGGAPKVVASSTMGIEGKISPDEKWILTQYQESGPVPTAKYGVIPAGGGDPMHVFPHPAGASDMEWSPDGKSFQVIFTPNGASNIWEQPLSGGPPHPVINFTSGRIFGFAWSRDGKNLYLAKGEIQNDVVLISNFR